MIKGYTKLMVELDSAVIVSILQNGKSGRSDGWPLVRKIKQVLDEGIWEIQFMHCYKEANKCAHTLAYMGSLQIQDSVYYDIMPSDVCKIVLDDSRGVSTPRSVAV